MQYTDMEQYFVQITEIRNGIQVDDVLSLLE